MKCKGYIGVYYSTKTRLYNANIRYNVCGKKKTVRIGSYEFAMEAALHYDEVAMRIFGSFAELNDPPPGWISRRSDEKIPNVR